MYELRRRIRMWGGDFDGRDLYCKSVTILKCDVHCITSKYLRPCMLHRITIRIKTA